MTPDITLDLQPTTAVVKIEDTDGCQHDKTRPVSMDDQRPQCVSCQRVVGEAVNLSIFRKYPKVGGELGISSAFVKLNDDELGILIDALTAVQKRRLGE